MNGMQTFRVAVFSGVCAMWVAFGVLYLLRKRPPCVPAVKKKSGLFAGLALQFAGYASVWAFGRRPWTPLVKMPATLEVAVGFLGLLLMAASVVLVVWAIRALGKEWSYQPRLVEGHELKTKGPYAIVRNPIYSGMLGMLVATGVAWSRWEALLGAMTVYLVGAAIRVRSEEALLRAAFGAAYEEYARRVPALIPRPW